MADVTDLNSAAYFEFEFLSCILISNQMYSHLSRCNKLSLNSQMNWEFNGGTSVYGTAETGCKHTTSLSSGEIFLGSPK